MPPFPIVDTHVHLYDIARLSYPWLDGVPTLKQTHLPADYDRARGAVEVEAMVFAEVDVADGCNVEEARFVAELARSDPRIRGIIGCARVERGMAAREELDALAETGLLRGIRRLIQHRPDPEFCLRPDFIAGVRLLPEYDLVFDVCITHDQLPNAIAFMRQCPDVTFVLDHIGKPEIRTGLMQPWKDQITELAHMPNVNCKISGVLTEADHHAWTREQVRPYVAHCIESFGFDRIMFGGDWPVVELAGDLPGWVGIVDWIVGGCSQHEKQRLFRDNAIRVYRLGLQSAQIGRLS